MNAQELEPYLLNFTKDNRYVTHTRLNTYLKLMNLMAEATNPNYPRGIGYYKPIGWFVMEQTVDGPALLWSERDDHQNRQSLAAA